MSLINKFGSARFRELLGDYLQILVGCFIGGIAYPLFLVPNSIAPGGLTGVATIFHHSWGWPVGTTSLLMNIPLFVISWRRMGKIFVFRSLVAMVLFSLCIDLVPFKPVTMDPLLGAVYGAGSLPGDWIEAIDLCRPAEGACAVPRPRAFWPSGIRALARDLCLLSQPASA